MQYCLSYVVAFITYVLCFVIFFAAGGFGAQSLSASLELAWLPVVFAPLGAPVALWLTRRSALWLSRRLEGLLQRRR